MEVGDEEFGKADTDAELRVRAAGTTLWVDRALEREAREGADWIVLRGRTSRNLVDGRGFVFDDVYGAFTKVAARSFELAWTTGELHSLLMGVNQFVGLELVPSSGRPTNVTGRVVVRPRLSGFSGASELYLTAELTPVVSGGRTVYRIRGSSSQPILGIREVAAGEVNVTDFRLVDDTHFQLDLLDDHVIALVGTDGEVAIEVNLTSGVRTKRARLGLWVKRLGLTAEDAYEVWPAPACTDEVRDCLAALPAGTTDLGPCGEAIAVNACAATGGVTVDDVAFQAALADADALLSDPAGFGGDAPALVGEEHAAEFAYAVKSAIEARLEAQFGRYYPSAAARDAALTADVVDSIDLAYARPLEHVEPWAPLPGDVGRARQVAADALLGWLAESDLGATEFQKPLEQLTRDYRADHVAGLRHFREEATSEPGAGDVDIYIGGWLGAHVEVSVSRATGAATNVYFEID